MISRNATQHATKKQPLHHCYWVWAALLTIILSTAAIRVRLLEVPLERDEGEYAYAGQLILQGVPPYAQVYNMKMPGIYAVYALILSVFGQTHSGIHLGLLVINAATIIVLFLLAKKLFDPIAGVAAAGAFALLSLGQSVQGVFANAEHFVILPALGGILLLLRAVDYQRWFSLLGGAVLLGLGFVMKQHGAAFIVFGGLYLLFSEIRRRPFAWKSFAAKGILFLFGVVLPFALTCFILWWCGVFEKFWFWTFDYAREYVSIILLLPAVALLAGIGVSSIQTLLAQSRSALAGRAIPILLTFFVLFHTIYQQRNFFFVMSPSEASRSTYGSNPFPESLEIARFIKEHSEKNDRIAVIGSEPQIYFYSNRRSATGYIYTYALMEKHSYALKMQEEMIREIESARPKFLVFVNVSTSWLVRSDSEKIIFKWFQRYQEKYFRQVGVIDIISAERTIYHWEEKVLGYSPLSKHWLLVFRRKS